jgi:hypothetical protein
MTDTTNDTTSDTTSDVTTNVTTSDVTTGAEPAARGSAEQRARRRAGYLAGLVWHVGAFVIINAFFWLIDLTVGRSGLQWSFWITAAWGFALAFHVLAYIVDGRQLEDRKTQQYLAAERARTP